MANTYQLQIDYVEAHRQVGDLEKVVHKVHYRYIVTNSDNKSAAILKNVDLPEVDPDSFTIFDNITKQMVTEWITPLIDEAALQLEADETLESIINPPNLILEINN